MDHRVFKNWIDQVWAPFALEKGDNTYLLMDEFSAHLMASCSNQIKGCGTTIEYILGGYTSKLQIDLNHVCRAFNEQREPKPDQSNS